MDNLIVTYLSFFGLSIRYLAIVFSLSNRYLEIFLSLRVGSSCLRSTLKGEQFCYFSFGKVSTKFASNKETTNFLKKPEGNGIVYNKQELATTFGSDQFFLL